MLSFEFCETCKKAFLAEHRQTTDSDYAVLIVECAKSRGSRGSRGLFLWVKLVSHSRGSNSWVILVGHSGGSFSWVKLVGHFRRSFWWVILVGQTCGSFLWVILGHWSFLYLELLVTLRSQNCPTILVRL